MPRIAGPGKVSRHVKVWDEDWELLDRLFGPASPNKVGVGNAVCAIIRKKCNELRADLNKMADGEGNK